jgi:ribosomal-protein-alanine N-acetyltransferase
MRRRHIPEVLAIEGRVYPRPWSARLFEDELARRGRAYLVARVGERVVGYAGLLMIADDGHVATLAVDPDWQRRGIARALLGELVISALDLGAEQLTLEVRVSNAGAQDLYRAFGFVPGGARKAYYADNGEDALVMWAHGIRGDDYQQRLASLRARPAVSVERLGPDASGPGAHPAAGVAPQVAMTIADREPA